jgi:hypothetical protein
MRTLTKLAMRAVTLAAALIAAQPALAADSEGCEGGGFRVTGFRNAAMLWRPGVRTTAGAALVKPVLQVRGKYNQFDIASDTFGVLNYEFTGAANPADMTGGKRVRVFQSKLPDHRGIVLDGPVRVSIDEGVLEVTRSGPGVTMKIQAKDCAAGGIFQMEIERRDGTATRVTHTLGPKAFFYDNPNFRAREGDSVPYKKEMLVVGPRVNIGVPAAAQFVARDSAQVATRVNDPTCANPIPTRDGGIATVQHCGRVSRWDVGSGGRLGFVTGEDAVEVAPPPTICTHKCRGRNRVKGQAVVLGFPFPVPDASLLNPAFP